MTNLTQDIGFLTLLGRLDLDPSQVQEVLPGGMETTNSHPLYMVVGASVAVCLHDPRTGLTGVCNVMLPSQFGHHRDDAMIKADSALDALRNRMLEQGAEQLLAKLFGAAETQVTGLSFSDGKQTAIFVRNWLRRHQVPILNESMGGGKRREIAVIAKTGQVFCKQISMSSEFLEKEKQGLLSGDAPLNKVELF